MDDLAKEFPDRVQEAALLASAIGASTIPNRKIDAEKASRFGELAKNLLKYPEVAFVGFWIGGFVGAGLILALVLLIRLLG